MSLFIRMAQAAAGGGLGPPPDVGLPTILLPKLLLNIINGALVLVAVIALAFLVYGGFLYITSRGDERQLEQAKRTITYAVLGIIVIGLAAALINFVVDAILQGGAGGAPPAGPPGARGRGGGL